MTKMDIYTRVLVELHPRLAPGAQMARLRLQDVLIELRNAAALERGDATGQGTQDEAEAIATRAAQYRGATGHVGDKVRHDPSSGWPSE